MTATHEISWDDETVLTNAAFECSCASHANELTPNGASCSAQSRTPLNPRYGATLSGPRRSVGQMGKESISWVTKPRAVVISRSNFFRDQSDKASVGGRTRNGRYYPNCHEPAFATDPLIPNYEVIVIEKCDLGMFSPFSSSTI
jgi:hypothetical protein